MSNVGADHGEALQARAPGRLLSSRHPWRLPSASVLRPVELAEHSELVAEQIRLPERRPSRSAIGQLHRGRGGPHPGPRSAAYESRRARGCGGRPVAAALARRRARPSTAYRIGANAPAEQAGRQRHVDDNHGLPEVASSRASSNAARSAVVHGTPWRITISSARCCAPPRQRSMGAGSSGGHHEAHGLGVRRRLPPVEEPTAGHPERRPSRDRPPGGRQLCRLEDALFDARRGAVRARTGRASTTPGGPLACPFVGPSFPVGSTGHGTTRPVGGCASRVPAMGMSRPSAPHEEVPTDGPWPRLWTCSCHSRVVDTSRSPTSGVTRGDGFPGRPGKPERPQPPAGAAAGRRGRRGHRRPRRG